MLHEILLAVQIGNVNYVKINQVKMTDTDPCKRISNIRAKAAKPCDRYISCREKLLRLR